MNWLQRLLAAIGAFLGDTQQREWDEFLSRSVDRADIEQRIHWLERHGINGGL